MYRERSNQKSELKLSFKDNFNRIKLKNLGIGLMIITNLGIKTLANEEINYEIKPKKEIQEIEIQETEIGKKIYYEIKPEQFMRKMGMNLCASYVKLIAQSKGYELNKVIYMNAWEMAYNMKKENWEYYDTNIILNLIMLKTNLEMKYHNSALKRIDKAKDTIDIIDYYQIREYTVKKEYDKAIEIISKNINEHLDNLPDGTLLFTINRNSSFRNIANRYRNGAPTHVMIKSDQMWRDYDVYNERIRNNEEMLRTTKNITHIITPPEINSVQSIDIEIPTKIIQLEGKKKLNKAIEFSQYKDIGMWQYLSYRIYESNNTEITIRKNKIEGVEIISVQGKSYGQGNHL